MRVQRITIQLALVLAILAGALALQPASPARAQTYPPTCGIYPYEFDTYEAASNRDWYGAAIELATAGKAIDFTYSVNGEPIDVTYQGLQQGPRSNRITALNKNLAIPPSIYKSIAWIEANYANASNSVPWGGVGPVLRSFDCGYGIGQITSGMANSNGTPTAKQAVIGTHFLYNISEGIRILAEKWNSAPTYRPIAGNGDPAMLEDWYFAIWSYNGFAFSNHPLNPSRDPLRGGGVSPVYHCYDPSAPSYQTNGGSLIYGYGSYTYQERVYGCMRFPPFSGGSRLWDAQTFHMPNFDLPEIARAFAPENFLNCEGGCAGMDYPTTIQREGVNITPNRDTTPPRDPADRGPLLGDPRFSYSGPNFMALTASKDGTVTHNDIVVSNVGAGVGPYRIRTSAPWLIVHHPGELRRLNAGVAVGNNIEVVKSPGVTQRGYQSLLRVTLDVSRLPAGTSQGKVWIEPLLGGGGVFEIDVVAANGAHSYPNKARLPALAMD